MEMRSFAVRFSESMVNACCNSGSLSASCMEPETSSKKTRLLGFASEKSMS